jgi:hypothetical protein
MISSTTGGKNGPLDENWIGLRSDTLAVSSYNKNMVTDVSFRVVRRIIKPSGRVS